MTKPIDFDGAADIADAITDAGGVVRDFDTGLAKRQPTGLAGALTATVDPTVRVYQFTVAIPADDPDDEDPEGENVADTPDEDPRTGDDTQIDIE